MANAWQMFIVRYLLIGIIGTATIVLGTSLLKAAAAQRDSLVADALLCSSRVQDMLARFLFRNLETRRQPPRDGLREIVIDRQPVRQTDTGDRQTSVFPAKDNPYAREYAAIKAEYEGFTKKVRQLQATRDSAQGDARMRHIDTLRLMKAQGIALRTALETAERKYESWNAAHANKSQQRPHNERF